MEFSNIARPLNVFVPFLVPVNKKKNSEDQICVEEENTKLQKARKLPL